MEVEFLNISVSEAIKMLTDQMNKGYQHLMWIQKQHRQNPSEAESHQVEWNKLYNEWMNETAVTLNKIYCEPHRVFNFQQKKFQHLSFTGDTLLTAFENAFDDRIQILKGYYDFIMTRSSITINHVGTLNFNNQQGNNNSNDQS